MNKTNEGALLDAYCNKWKLDKGSVCNDNTHWDVTHPDGTHTNVNPEGNNPGSINHGNDNFK